MTIPFNAASQLVSAPEAIARAVGADEQDIQAMNFALLMTGIEELNMPRQMAQSATAANQGKTVASMWTEATDAANAIKEGKTASTTATSSEAIGSLRSTQLPPEYFDEAMSRLEQGDLRTSGDLISDLTSHAQSAAARAERGLSAQTGQSAHISARSAMRGVAGYDPRAALTRLLDSTAHRGFDDYWKAVFRRMANSSGETQISVADYFNVMRDAIGNNPHFTNGEAISMVELLRDELFVQYGLRDADMLRLPYSRGL